MNIICERFAYGRWFEREAQCASALLDGLQAYAAADASAAPFLRAFITLMPSHALASLRLARLLHYAAIARKYYFITLTWRLLIFFLAKAGAVMPDFSVACFLKRRQILQSRDFYKFTYHASGATWYISPTYDYYISLHFAAEISYHARLSASFLEISTPANIFFLITSIFHLINL